MRTRKNIRLAINNLLAAAVLLLLQIPVQAQPGSGRGSPNPVNVNVTNSDDSPVPVRVVAVPTDSAAADTEITISFTSGFVPGDSEQTMDAPSCPSGSEFLVTALSASRSASGSADLRPWEARVRLEQRYAVGPGVPADLVVGAEGRAQGQAGLPAGQALREAGKVSIVLTVEGHASLKPGFISAHITGECGEPYVVPNESLLPGQIERGNYPLGWDLQNSAN